MDFQTVEREQISGTQTGIHYTSGSITVLARSPKAILLWIPGGNYSSGRMTHYASAKMVLYYENPWSYSRSRSNDFKHDQDKPAERLTAALVLARAQAIDDAFGAGAAEEIAKAVKAKTTLLIDGGGNAYKEDPKVTRKKREARLAKVNKAVNREIEPQGVCTCRQCGRALHIELRHHYIESEDPHPPKSLEDVQRRHNELQVISIEGEKHNEDRAGMIRSYKTWDGVSYDYGDLFCNESCAALYAERAVRELAPLPIVKFEPEALVEPFPKMTSLW